MDFMCGKGRQLCWLSSCIDVKYDDGEYWGGIRCYIVATLGLRCLEILLERQLSLDFIYSLGFISIYATESQNSISSLDIFIQLQIYRVNCLQGNSMWLLKFSMYKTIKSHS